MSGSVRSVAVSRRSHRVLKEPLCLYFPLPTSLCQAVWGPSCALSFDALAPFPFCHIFLCAKSAVTYFYILLCPQLWDINHWGYNIPYVSCHYVFRTSSFCVSAYAHIHVLPFTSKYNRPGSRDNSYWAGDIFLLDGGGGEVGGGGREGTCTGPLPSPVGPVVIGGTQGPGSLGQAAVLSPPCLVLLSSSNTTQQRPALPSLQVTPWLPERMQRV